MADNGLPAGFEIVDVPKPPKSAKALSGLPAGFEVASTPKEPGTFAKVADIFTGNLRTEFPDAPEFGADYLTYGGKADGSRTERPTWGDIGQSLLTSVKGMPTRIAQDLNLMERPQADAQAQGPDLGDLSAVARSGITSDPDAHLDIIKMNFPGIETRKDSHGNIMVRPQGYADFAYLNKPGVSTRDVDEFGTQTLATLPFLGTAGAGNTVAQRLATGAGLTAAGEGFRQTLEQAAGSEQGYSPGNIALAGTLGGVTAPGVASTAADLVKSGYQRITEPTRELIKGLANPSALAEKRVAQKLLEDTDSVLGPMSPNYSGKLGAAPTADELGELAAGRLKDPASVGVEGLGPDARLFDIMGEPGRDLARWSANVSSRGRQTMQDVVNPRFEAQADRTISFVRDLADHPLTARQSAADLEKTRHMLASSKYRDAFDAGSGGLSTPALEKLMQESPTVAAAGKEAIRRLSDLNAAGLMHGPDVYGANGLPTLELWDMTKRVIDGYIKKAERNKDMQEVFRLGSIREKLIDELDTQVPKYGAARGTAEKFFNAEDALDAGAKFASPGARYSNDEVRDLVSKMSPNDRALFERGYVDRLVAEVHEAGDRKNIVAMFRTPAISERLEIALGPDKADKLTSFLRTEHALDFIRGAFGNSTTARQLAQMGIGATGGAALAGLTSGSTDPATLLKGVLIGGFVKGAHGRARMVLDSRVGEEVAKLLVSKDPEVFKRGMKLLDQLPEMRKNLERFSDMIPAPARNVATQAAIRQSQGD